MARCAWPRTALEMAVLTEGRGVEDSSNKELVGAQVRRLYTPISVNLLTEMLIADTVDDQQMI